MDALPGWLILSVLALLRIGVPVALTLLAGYILVKLDAKWQAEELARQERARAAGETPDRPHCWETKGCSPDTREKCVAFKSALPCWMAKRRAEGRIPDVCFSCPVLVNA